MGRIKTPQDIHNCETWEEAQRFVSAMISACVQAINGGIDLVENCSTQVVSLTFSEANVQASVGHALKRVPQGYLLVGGTAAMSIYDGTTPNTDELLYLRASAAGTARVLVF